MVKDKQMVLPQILIQANLGDELMRFTIHAHMGRKMVPKAPERIPKVSFGRVWYIPLSVASDLGLGDQPSFTHLRPPNKRLSKTCGSVRQDHPKQKNKLVIYQFKRQHRHPKKESWHNFKHKLIPPSPQVPKIIKNPPSNQQ